MKTLSEDRRALHRIPETGCRLPETAAYLRGALAEMPCTLLAPWEDAVCAYFDLGKDETVAVRSDMDALPVTERTGLPFASQHPGRMHACGHDGHMAMVLGLARRLAAGEVRPQRNVLLIFEPAEETTGGAAPICATGLLERYHVTRVFGMHLWPELPAGVIASRAGAMMSRSCELTVEITGRSVHLARFAEGCDALDAAARLLEQTLLSRGATVDRIRLREYAIHPCIGCGYCSAHPGHCVFDGDDVADLFRRMEHADSLILNIPVYFYGPPALLKGFIDRAQIFWEQRREGTRTPRRPAHAVLCAARTRGDRLFEANLLILRCFLDTLGFSLHEPLLLRGVERPTDLLHSQAIAQIERFGLEAAEQATRFYHE